jgi:hypothetical protein
MHGAWGPHERSTMDRAGSGNMYRAGSGNMYQAGGGNINRAGSGNLHRAGSGSGRGGRHLRAGSAPRGGAAGLPSRASGLRTQGSGFEGTQGAQAGAGTAQISCNAL